MSDVMKMVEEALVEIADDGIENSRDRRTVLAQSALAALRWLEWREIDPDMQFTEKVSVGKWHKILKRWVWITSDGWQSMKAAKMGGYTHFCRPILPMPPKREVENAG